MNLPSRRILAILLTAASGGVLSLYAYFGSFTRLMADDYCSVYFARPLSMLRFIWFAYLNWGGRYSAIAVDSFLKTIAPDGLWFFPLAVIVLWLAVTFLALREVLKAEVSDSLPAILSLALAAFLLVTILTVSPLVQQALYWWNGMRTYIPELISVTFHIGFLYWARGKLQTRRALLAGMSFSFLVAFFSGGFNETFTVIQFLFFAGFTGLGLLTKRLRTGDPAFYLLAAPIAASLLSLLIMLTSPGTAIRWERSNTAPDIVTALAIALDIYGKYLNFLLTTTQHLLTLIGLAMFSIWVGTGSDRKDTTAWMILFALASGVILSFASLVPSAYAFSELPAFRTFIVPTFALMLGLLFAGLATGRWLAGQISSLSLPHVRVALTTLTVLLVLASCWLNGTMLYSHRDDYFNFAERWDATNAQILRAKAEGADSVTIPTLGNWANLEEPNQNPNYWVNQCYSVYYGLQVFGPPLNMQAP